MDRDLESIREARRLVEKAAEAQKVLAGFTQEQIDTVVSAMAEAARRAAERLARLAVEETTYGVVADKVVKNLFSARDVYQAIKSLKTVGVIREDKSTAIVEMAVPAGVVVAIIPCTNPTSTAIFKALIAVKGANAIVMSPHPSAVKCIRESARVMAEAALQAGAPEGSVGCLSAVTPEATQELMRHRLTSIILATGGTGLVRAAYSSGKPALGVGPGNVPAYIHSSAKIPKAVADILAGKCFDNGTLCSAEQHMVVDQAVADQVRAETERQGGYFLTPEQAGAVARQLILPNLRVNPKLVGHSAQQIAQAAGFSIPADRRALVAPLEGIGRDYPLSAEKLSPVLSFYVVKDTREALEVCRRLLEFGGMGHTMSIHATDDQVIREFALKLPAFRMVANTPASHGSVGYTTGLFPSMSLGCGTPGGNITSDNISPIHLLNIKRLAYELRPVSLPAQAGQVESGERTARPALGQAVSVPSAPPAAGPDRTEVMRIVERFLGSRGSVEALPSREPKAEPPPAAKEAASRPSPRAVEFVSEDDVRYAIRKGEKIYVSARTIITPAARDLGDPQGVFVQTP